MWAFEMAFLTQHNAREISKSLCISIIHPFLVLNSIPWYRCNMVCLINHLPIERYCSCLLFFFLLLQIKLLLKLYTGFCENEVIISLRQVSRRTSVWWVYSQGFKKLSNYFPEWLSNFTLLPVMDERSWLFISAVLKGT